MCGIAGIIASDLAPTVRAQAVERMCASMVHRGPDDSGCVSVEGATLGMRRLAIFDPANGRQPFVSPDGRYSLVFNGAIYNYRALRGELAADWTFRTDCDTEVLLAAYARWGYECLPRLRGMFAFAVWDRDTRTLLFARDAHGIKPLYFHHAGDRLVLASELNALLASGFVAAEIDPVSVGDYLAWLAVPAPRTIYRSVFSLRPGERAIFRDGKLTFRSISTFDAIPAADACRTRPEFVEQLRERLAETIRAHTVADVPVGAFLSGGLDSAAVVGLMARANAGPLRTFSIAFDEADYSEADAAAETARHFGTRHHTSILTGTQVGRELPDFLAALDQPTGDGLNTYYASRAARAGGVTVALSGLGGDELFGGYPSFRATPLAGRWLPRWQLVPGPLRRLLAARLARGDTRRRKLADLLAHARDLGDAASLQRRVFATGARDQLLAPDVRAALARQSALHPETVFLAAELAGAAGPAVVSAWELRTYMADVLLRDSDVMSMRHSLELRVPFIDQPLVAWLWHQPAAFRFAPPGEKSALREALGPLLPPALSTRPKRGFSLPFPLWMRGPLKPFLDDAFSDASIARTGCFDPTAVRSLWQNYQSSGDTREWSRVWSLAVLLAFARRPRPAPAASPAVVSIRPETPARGTRALLLAPEIFASEGGIPRILQTYLSALCEPAADAGGSVRLLALNDGAIRSAPLRRTATGALECAVGCARSKAAFTRHALRLARDCDILICGHVAQLPVALLAQKRYPRLRYYLIAHGIEVWRPFNVVERAALRRAHRIFCVSEFTRRELLGHCPLPPDRAVVLPNALDPTFAIARGQPLAACPPVILCVTRLTYADRYKGVQHLIEAMPAVRREIPGAILRIVGRGDDVARLTALRDRLGLGAAVEFTGFVDDQRLARELHGCRLFALPSRKEGFGLVFLEAMAHSRPCLGARAGGAPEVLNDDTGILVDYGDIPAIAGGLVGGLRRPWDENRILARAREFSYSPFKARLASLLAA